MTLYEIVLSLAILLGSMAVMANMIATGSRAATQSQLRTKAALFCEATLAEVVARAKPMTASSGNSFAELSSNTEQSSHWTWDLEVFSGLHDDLVGLELTVNHTDEDGAIDATSTLVRFVRDPGVYDEAAALQAAAEATDDSSE
jgi:hypothetical protein